MPFYKHRSAPKGGFGSFLGKVAGTVVGFATGGVGGAVKGHIAGGKIGNLVAPGKPKAQPTVPSKQQLLGGPLGATPIGWAINKLGPMVLGPSSGSVEMQNGQCPKGYHPNKQDSPKGAAGTYCVRNRSMNPANGRAIGRAATRIKRGAKQYAKVLRILGKKTGKMVPKSRRRS